MLKRSFAVLLVAGLVGGGAAVAVAGDAPSRPTLLAAAQSEDTPPSTAAGAPDRAEIQARREALRTCLEQAGENEESRRACFQAAGPGIRHHKGRPGHAGPAGFGPLGRAVHGTVVVPNPAGGWHEVAFDRGEVDEATDGSKIVLDRPDGQTVTIALTDDTKYRGVADASALVEGRPALVVSQDGKALQVVQKDPARHHGPGNNGVAPDVPND